MIKECFFASVFVILSAITGCAVVPGSYLFTYDKEIIGQEGRAISELVEIHPITADLLLDLSAPPMRPRANPKMSEEIARYKYTIGKGDILNIIVYEHEELTIPAGSYRSAADSGNWVKSDGTIYYPYVGNLNVEGKTIDNVRQVLVKKLAKYIQNPFVDVSVVSFLSKRVYVTGEVAQPGAQPITNIPLTLLDAVNESGGLTDKADWSHVVLSRNGAEEIVSLEALLQFGVLTENRLLRHNDIIHVPRNDGRKVFVLGEIATPASLTIDRAGMSLTEALGRAGGIDQNAADATGVFVIRKAEQVGGKAKIFQFDMSDASALLLGSAFRLEAYDVVYVTAAPISIWNRIINQLLPTLNAYDLLNKTIKVTN